MHDGIDSAKADRAPSQTGATERPFLRPEIVEKLDAWFGAARRDAIHRAMRPPCDIMTPEAISLMKSSALSFYRTLMRRMAEKRWDIRMRLMEIDTQGHGHALYDVEAEGHIFTLIVRSRWDGVQKIGRRSDSAVDFVASIVKGRADDALVRREIRAMDVPSWNGRTDSISYGFSGCNRSQRFFDHVVDALTAGQQPDLDYIARQGGGYVLRNAGYYGNGRAGAASWLNIPAENHPFSVPYHIDLFLMYMWRQIGCDFMDGIAARRSPRAARLATEERRYLGVGNSSGLGMTLALVRWPQWVGTWVLMREVALAYAMTEPPASVARHVAGFGMRVRRAIAYFKRVVGPDHALIGHDVMVTELALVLEELQSRIGGAFTWAAFCADLARRISAEALEQVHAILIDLHPECTVRLTGLIEPAMRRQRHLEPAMTMGRFREILDRHYDWALAIDRSTPERSWHFWYQSTAAGENRRGERLIDPGVEVETFVDVVGAVQQCDRLIREGNWPDEALVAEFVIAHPEQAYIVTRIQFVANEPYAEIRGNLIDKEYVPMRGIRFYLTVFGFDSAVPRPLGVSYAELAISFSVRGVLGQGAPLLDDIRAGRVTDWVMPELSALEA